jgi:hypothetical protein
LIDFAFSDQSNWSICCHDSQGRRAQSAGRFDQRAEEGSANVEKNCGTKTQQKRNSHQGLLDEKLCGRFFFFFFVDLN